MLCHLILFIFFIPTTLVSEKDQPEIKDTTEVGGAGERRTEKKGVVANGAVRERVIRVKDNKGAATNPAETGFIDGGSGSQSVTE